MSLKTYFQGVGQTVAHAWQNFMNWFGAAEAEVVAEGKTIVDELVPVVKADILADSGTALAIVGAALATGTDPLAAIALAASTVWKEALAQGIEISKAASTTAGAFLVAKSKTLATAAKPAA